MRRNRLDTFLPQTTLAGGGGGEQGIDRTVTQHECLGCRRSQVASLKPNRWPSLVPFHFLQKTSSALGDDMKCSLQSTIFWDVTPCSLAESSLTLQSNNPTSHSQCEISSVY
jgi:hypothetical protein